MTESITLRRPDDWHIHLRDAEIMQAVLPHTSRHFARAIVMPNLVPPVTTTDLAEQYRQRIQAACLPEHDFTPLMTLYLTETADPQDYIAGFKAGVVTAAKLYPAGATTNSDAGVRELEKVYPVLEAMEKVGMPLLIHGEVVDEAIDIFDREAVFIEEKLIPLCSRFPGLRIVFEHITTQDGVEFVRSCSENMAATITPHHLVINRNAMLVGGIKPHYYCLPVAKREIHRESLLAAAISGDARFFLGTDSAPHSVAAKESDCGCAGIFNVPVTLPLLAEVFEQHDALGKLEGFCSQHGANFYQLPQNETTITVEKKSEPVTFADEIKVGSETIKVFDPLMPVHWCVVE